MRMWTQTGSLRFPGDPSHAFALLQDPGRADRTSPLTVLSMLPPAPTNRRPQRVHDLEAATGLQHPLPTLHERRCRRPCKARFRLTGCAFAGRVSNPLDRSERFQVIPFPFPGLCLTQAGCTPSGWCTSSCRPRPPAGIRPRAPERRWSRAAGPFRSGRLSRDKTRPPAPLRAAGAGCPSPATAGRAVQCCWVGCIEPALPPMRGKVRRLIARGVSEPADV